MSAIDDINDIWGRVTTATAPVGNIETTYVPKKQIMYTEDEVEALIYKAFADEDSDPQDFWKKNKKK